MATYTSRETVSPNIELVLTVTQNNSSCNALLQLVLTNQASFSASYVAYGLSGDTSASGGGGSASYGSGTHTLLDQNFTKSGSVSVTGNIYVPAFGWNVNVTASGGQTKPVIKKCKVSPRSEKSVLVQWEADATIDIVRYQYKPSGGSWQTVERNITDATSGIFRITDLASNKKHYFNLMVRRKSDSTWSDWSQQQEATTYTTPTQESVIENKTETSLNIKWTCDSNVTKLQYSTDGGDTWSSVQTFSARKTDTYTISGLVPETQYRIKTRLNRDTDPEQEVWSNTTTLNNDTTKTYQYPYVKSIGTSDLNVGASTLTQTFKLYNPKKRNVTVYMKLANNTVITCGSTTNGTDVAYTYTFTTSGSNNDKDKMNSSITDTTLTKNATYYCTYSSQTIQTVSGKYHINSTDTNYKPTFSTSNWSYTTNYVKNDTVVANKSTITVNVNTSATPKTGATITGYTIKWGNQTKTITGTTGSVTMSADSSTTLKVIANDSRGFSTETSRTIPVIAYTDPTCDIDADRTDGVGSDVFLSLNGNYYKGKLYTNSTTQADNTILSIKYAISTTTSYATDYTIPLSSVTINNGSYNLSDYQIYSDGSSAGFTIGTRYNIRIKVQDRYQTKIFTGTITDGKIAVDCYQDSNGDYHRGINGLANSNYAEYINGDFGVTRGNKVDVGSGGINGSTQHDDLFVYNTGGWIYVRPKGKDDSTNQFTFKNTGVLLIPIALQIPKNSNDGYGLCNSDGISIIRDYGNQNVTVDATGRTLFLGYKNTTGINIVPNIITDVTIDHGNSSNHYLYIGNTSNKNLNEVRTRNNTLDIGMGVDNGGTYRIWNYTHSREVIRISSAGVNSFNGNASTATKATQDGDGNNIPNTYLKKKNVARGTVSITPSANNTPTSKAVSWSAMDGTPTIVATANASASQVINVMATGASTTGGTIWLLASNTTARNVFYIAIYT